MARRGSGGSSFDSVNRWAAQERKRQEKRDRASDRAERGRSRSFPPTNGTVDDQPANVEQEGQRTVAYYGQNNKGKIVSNDGGLNADYVRDDDGTVVADAAQGDPYQPYKQRKR